ncbi:MULTISPECIES: gamma-glutamyltransferase family protein [unclassified Yoonia]|uniref:gamma-glutamyltransferase family protein n=1 Tax=unclassified Yoonia TaxID=2629118 RepID=UPI002AFE7D7C|nr:MULTISPECIES: gamma-glutamyltransferase family protein [unclassified Yoonia]
MPLRHDALYPSRRSPVLAENVAATSHPLATQAALAMMARGGNAVDAAIAAAATLTVVEPTGNGLGSDAYCILWDGKELRGLNASGASPEAWTPDYFRGQTEVPYRGWGSVTVPGAVSAWAELTRRFGKLDLPTVLAPAINYAESGFTVSPVIGTLWQRGAEVLSGQPGFADMFMPGGQVPKAGERFRSADMANTLQRIAESGGRDFYEGTLAEKIAADARANGATLTVADLAAHQPEWCGTIATDYRDVTLHEIPPNGQGIAALMALGILEHLDLAELQADDPMALHLQIEAIKLAFADLHKFVADAKYMTKVTPEDLINPDYLKGRAKLVSRDHAQNYGPGAPKTGGTVYLTTADASGMMVSFIQSNYSGFGSGVVVPGTGISLQNRGAGFTLEPGHPNEVGPRKRPFQTIIPGFLMQGGKPKMSFGVMGGPMQAQGHVQMVMRTHVWDQDVQTAIDAPRWRFIEGRKVACESALSETTRAELAALGHEISVETPDSAFGFGGAQLIEKRDAGGYAAGSDPRKDGQAGGF